MKLRLVVPCAAAFALAGGAAAAETASSPSQLDCLIEPFMVVNVSAAVDGVLESVAVDRGDLVRQGQVLATLDSRVEAAAVEIARARAAMEGAVKSGEARLEFSSRQVTRTQDLYKKEIVPAHEMDEVETSKLLAERGLLEALENKKLAELELRRASAALDMRKITSPINGVVVERFLHPGELVNEAPILKLAQIDPLRVEVFAPVALLGKVTAGMRAEVLPEVPVGGVHVARVTVVDRVVDAASGTFGVRLELHNPGGRLPAGLKCKVHFLSK